MVETQDMPLKLKPASQSSYIPPLKEKKEREVANYPIGRGLKARIIVYGDRSVSLGVI